MRHFSYILLFFLASCGTRNKHPEGGYDYPKKVADKDTNLYFYPIMDIESKKDAFKDSYAYLFYQPFEEPNLSIRPQIKETFRLTFSSGFGDSFIITLTEDSLVVKKGSPRFNYNEDTSRLSETENAYLRLFKKWYPIESWDDTWKDHVDSLVKLYPQLTDPTYYHQLYDKTIVSNCKTFYYPVNKILISKDQYQLLIRQIDSSGFWKMPYQIKCEFPPRHSDFFIFEANTTTKYKVVYYINCPDDATKFVKACQKLIDFARLDQEIHLIWTGGIDSAKQIK